MSTLNLGRIVLQIVASLRSTLDLSAAPVEVVSVDYSKTFTHGTGANQANTVWSDTRTLAASATENLDLSGVLTNVFGESILLTKIKAIIIKAASANTNDVLVGGAATNAWLGMFVAAPDVAKVKPGGFLAWAAPDATGGPVVAATGDILKIANSAAGTAVTYDIIIIGAE